MQDLISKQAAIEAVEHITSSMSVCVNTDECHGMKRMQRQAVIELANLPSAQPESQWIPVSKKSHPDTPERVQVQLDNGWIITAYYEENEWLSVPYCDEPIEDRWIEAWKPLPEPYGGG